MKSCIPCTGSALGPYLAFPSKHQALAFECYWPSGSGYAFSRKRLWPAPLP